MKKRTGRGGRGRNQGLRPGTHKNALKAQQDRHSVKKQVTFTPDEFAQVEAARQARNMDFSAFGRECILQVVKEQQPKARINFFDAVQRDGDHFIVRPDWKDRVKIA